MKWYYAFIIVLILGCESPEPELSVYSGNAFGTTYTIQLYTSELPDIEKGLDSVFYVVNKSVSTYMPDSDISRINAGDSTVVVDKIFTDVFELSSEVHKQSQGYFDPTIGVLRNAYGFGDVKPLEKIDSDVLDSLMQFVGFGKVNLTEANTIRKTLPEVYFDFNAVAKGYGIDCIGRYLESEGIKDYLVELGGEILARGTHLSKEKLWTVGIESVDSEIGDRSYQETIQLSDQAMASSGNYRKFRIDSVTGQRYVHTLNPLTGSAEKSDVTSATIVAEDCATADAYATACMAMGLSKAQQMLSQLGGVEAYLTYNDSLGVPKVYMTRGFKDLLSD